MRADAPSEPVQNGRDAPSCCPGPRKASRFGVLDQRTLLTGITTGLVTASLWGSWAVISRLGVLGSLNAWDICFLRYLATTIVLAPWLLRRGAVTRAGIMGVSWQGVAVLSVTGGLPYMMMVMIGLGLAPASRHAVFGSGMMPLLTFALSWLLLGERAGARQLLGTLLTSAGVVLTVFHGFMASASPLGFGDLLFAGSAVLWASYTVASRIYRVKALPAVVILSMSGAIVSTLIYLPVYGLAFLRAPLAEIVGQALYQGILTGLIATMFYMRTIESLGAARAALFVAFVPPLVTLFAWPILGERPTWFSLAGVALVSIGMIVAVTRR